MNVAITRRSSKMVMRQYLRSRLSCMTIYVMCDVDMHLVYGTTML
jgi:hypothetical protein